jgi:hypothetical protein
MSDNIDFAALIGPVAKRLWGEPNRNQKPGELRWGTNGSKSVNLFKAPGSTTKKTSAAVRSILSNTRAAWPMARRSHGCVSKDL